MLKKSLVESAIIILLSFSLAACSASGIQLPQIQQMLVNLSSSYPAIWDLISDIAYFGGLVLLARAIFQLKQYGANVSMMSTQHDMKGPLISFFTGSALLFLPSIQAAFMDSVFGYGQPIPIAYSSATSLLDQQSMNSLLGLIQIVGMISFVRGWFQMSRLASPSGAQNITLGKSLTHIIGGILAINIQGTINLLGGAFGINS